MRTYIINLDRNPDRMAAMDARFAQLGLSYERFTAIDGKEFTEEAFQAFAKVRPLKGSGDFFTNGARRWNKGKMGCFLSHHAIWTTIAGSSERYSAVFEDDLHMADDMAAILRDDNWIPDGCGIIKLEPSYNRIKLSKKPVAVIAGRAVHEVIPSNIEQCWPVGAGAYILSREVARELAHSPPHTHTMADIYMFNPLESPLAKNIRLLQMVPPPCIQDILLPCEKQKFFYASDTGTLIGREPNLKWLPHKLMTLRRILSGYRRIEYSG